ncbi:MAG TPA: type II secretion system protein GspE, partial [Clostridia bacterium]
MLQGKSRFLGNQLIKLGKITPEQLEKALKQQKLIGEKGKKGKLGQILVDMGFCTEEDIADAMAKKSGSVYYSLNKYVIDINAMNLIPPETAVKYQALAIGFDGGRLLVAFMNPDDIIAIDDLRILTGYDIQPVVVPDKELTAAIKKYVRDSSDIEHEDDYVEEIDLTEEMPEDDKPAVMLANQILNMAVNSEASDVHI